MLQKLAASPIYAQIRESLREQITAGHFDANAPLSEAAIANEFNISRDTVRRALTELKAEGLLKRIRGKGTFVREVRISGRKSSHPTIAIVTSHIDIREFASGLSNFLQAVQLASAEYELRLSYYTFKEAPTATLARLRADKTLKGAIAIWVDDQTILNGLADLPIPTVLLESLQPTGGAILDDVLHSCEESVDQAVTSLLQLGHRDIGLMQSHRFNSIGYQRQAGYERALKAAGLPVREEMIYRIPPCAEGAYTCMNEIIKSARIPTAMFCTGDNLATGAIFAAMENGLRVPRDLSVIGFGDTTGFVSPPLSTVHVPVEQMGREALRILNERLKQPSKSAQHVVLPAMWISRASCAIPPQALPKETATTQSSIANNS
jgi:DNA-binding LacI/PurR family transcriptional regulator